MDEESLLKYKRSVRNSSFDTGLTSMPSMGIRVISSRNRKNAKVSDAITMSTLLTGQDAATV